MSVKMVFLAIEISLVFAIPPTDLHSRTISGRTLCHVLCLTIEILGVFDNICNATISVIK